MIGREGDPYLVPVSCLARTECKAMSGKQVIQLVFTVNVLVATSAACGQAASFSFTTAAKVPAPTVAHSAVTLPGGDVLVTGGYGQLFGKIPLVTTLARIYDHQKLSWRIAKGQLNYARLGHNSIVLASGKVLIVGGIGQNGEMLRSIELFDPATEKFHLLLSMAEARKNPRLNLLPDGRVLITGEKEQAEIVEPAKPISGKDPDVSFVVRATLGKSKVKHSDHAVVTLADGAVLLIGGRTTRIERFDPKTETFELCRSRLPKVLDDQTAVVLYNGKVFLAGGQEVYTNRCVNQTWFYDPTADILTEGPRLNPTAAGKAQRGTSDMCAVDLFTGDGNRGGRYFLICGGEDDPGTGSGPDVILDSAWVYDAPKGDLINVGPMKGGHDDFAAVYLPPAASSARALIIAGHGPGDSFSADCEIFSWKHPN